MSRAVDGAGVLYRRADEMTWDTSDDRAVILNAQGSTLITLNPVGTLLWAALDRPRSAHDLAQQLHREFADVALEQLTCDVEEFIESMTAEGLLVAQRDES